MSVSEAALGRLVTLYESRVYRTAYAMVKDPYLAQDVTQETFLKAYRHLGSVKDERRAGAWLRKIATNAAIDLLRRRRCWNGIPTENETLACLCGASAEGVEEEVCRRLGAEALRGCVDRLPATYREVVRLKIECGWKDADVARRIGVSVGTVKSRFHRAKGLIRSRMNGLPSISETSPGNFGDGSLPLR